MSDERTKELLPWAARFAAMHLHAADVRYPIQAHVAKIVEHTRQQPDLSGFSDEEVRKLGAERAQMITQLDYLRVSAVALATSATHEQAHAASRERRRGRQSGRIQGRQAQQETDAAPTS